MTTPTGQDVAPAWFVYTFRDGMIASLESYLDRDMAYESASLGPTPDQDDSPSLG